MRVRFQLLSLAAVSLIGAAGCGSSSGSSFDGGRDGTLGDALIFSDPDGGGVNRPDMGSLIVDTGAPDAGFSADAFFYMDPPAMYCLDGGTAPPTPGGTPQCPSDKNRQGCPCSPVGQMAACWPGPRADRDLGDCKDGTTTCISADEGLGSVWGACNGYVLPVPGATGAAACSCFSSGEWAIANLSPCFITYGAPDSGAPVYAFSSNLDGTMVTCPMQANTPPPMPAPGVPWSTDTLKVDCAGTFKLCYTIKAGSATSPQPTDCVIGQSCVSGTYPTAGVVQTFPPLAGWGGTNNSACAATFVASGGYGEMTVQGVSATCEGIGTDDGGAPEVFNRIPYCSFACQADPTASGCQSCMTGGSGTFPN